MASSDVLGAPLEEVEFLARSPNRVSALDVLTRGAFGRYELEDEAGVTRATLGRILDDFEERGWVTETDRRYETTQLGTYVSETFMHLLARFEPVPALNEVAQWFPGEGFEFHLGRLAGATIVRSTTTSKHASTRRGTCRCRDS